LASKIRIALSGVLTAIALNGCGGGDNVSPASCQSPQPLPVRKFSYPNDSVLIGQNVSLVPTIEVTTGDNFGNAILRYDLVAGPLPSGLSLDPTTGRISGRAGQPPGAFPFTVRVSADCFTDPVTTSAFISVQF
jgi:Putative Ig domain